MIALVASGILAPPAPAQDGAAAHYVDAHTAFLREAPGGYDNDGLNYAAAIVRDIDGRWLPMSILMGAGALSLGSAPSEEGVAEGIERFCGQERAEIEIMSDGDYVFRIVRQGTPTTFRSVSLGLFAISIDVPAQFARLGLDEEGERFERQRSLSLMTAPREAIVYRPYPEILAIRYLGQSPEIYLRCSAE
jgi:hypothetical protein